MHLETEAQKITTPSRWETHTANRLIFLQYKDFLTIKVVKNILKEVPNKKNFSSFTNETHSSNIYELFILKDYEEHNNIVIKNFQLLAIQYNRVRSWG